MEPRLSQSQRQTQRLILAPQLRQFLHLLQLPVLELEQKISEELTQNPVLEEATSSTSEDGSEDSSSDTPTEDSRREENLQAIESIIENAQLASIGETSDLSVRNAKENQRQRDYQESILTKHQTLADYLEWQLGILDLTAEEVAIANELIGNINQDGYLAVTLEDVAKTTSSTPENVAVILKTLQSLEPPGIGGRDLQEVLLIQLSKVPRDSHLATKILQSHFDLFKRKHLDQLARTLDASLDQVKAAYQQISKLEPKPGRVFYSDKPNFVVPDARVVINESNEEQLTVELTDESVPRLRISNMYRQLFRTKDIDLKTRTFLQEKIQSGLDLIRALGQRKSTMKLIVEEIVRAQKNFFTKGFSHLKPLRLKDVADKVGIHESTVSRAIQGKYLDTPQGMIPFKSFFSGRLESGNGTDESQKSAMEKLRTLILHEDKQKPFSDSKLVQLMEQEEIKIARRTIAKYRDVMRILPAHLRKVR